jgi:hypothetical protein
LDAVGDAIILDFADLVGLLGYAFKDQVPE